MPTVYSKRQMYPLDAVYVGRPTEWGNPFALKDNTQADRDRVCDLFEDMCAKDPAYRVRIKHELKGKDLLCWCAPARCHADTLLRIANEE